MTVGEALQSIVGSDYVRDGVSEDSLDGVQPQWVVESGTTEEVAGVLSLAAQHGLAVAPRGGGTKSCWGNPPERLDLILSVVRMNVVLEHQAGDLVVRVQAGARLRDIQAALAGAGQWLPLDPPHADATIGGVIASNASGPHRLRYGTARDLLIGITYVLPDGTIAKAGGKVVKNVAGYDLCKLFTGSLGTLGVIVEVILRLHPLPVARRTVMLRTREDTLGGGELVQTILHSTLVPSAIEYLQGSTGSRLGVLFEGVEPGVIAQAALAERLLEPHGDVWTLAGSEETVFWRQWGELSAEAPAGSTRLKVACPLADVHEIRKTIKESLDGSGGRMQGHEGNGITDALLQLEEPLTIDGIRRIRDRAERMAGSAVILDCPPGVKRELDVWGSAGDALPLMRAVKARFDPNGILNPGRFVGGI